MSSGPVGLDVREYVYGHHSQVLNLDGFWEFSSRKNWLITKVQFYTPAGVAGQVGINPYPTIPVAASSCLILEPNGAAKDKVIALGNGALIIIEYWFQAQAGTFVQNIAIDTVPP